MKNIVVIIMLLIGLTTLAQEKKNKNAKYTIEVNGNCEMCQKRIQKAAMSVSGVKMASWDISSGELKLLLNEEKCNIKDVEKAVAKAGHDTKNVKATSDDYDKLHGCCQYERIK